MQEVRWDRVVIRALVCAAVVFSTFPVALRSNEALPPWRVTLGLIAAVVLGIAVLIGLGQPSSWTPRSASRVSAGLTIAASTVVTVALPFDPGVWIPFLGAAAAGIAAPMLPWGMALAAPPVLALAWRTWTSGGTLTALLVNVGAAVAAYALAHERVRQREARELAEAQRRVIELERHRLRSSTQQRDVAAQLHDVLAHTLSGLIVTLQGAALAARQERVSSDLAVRLDTATALAKDGLAEARSAVESLHTGATGRAPELGRWLAQALERLRSGGGIDVTVDGHPDSLPAQWSDLARSVLMEALTNTVRHAAGAPVRITFDAPPAAGVSVLSVGDPATFTDRRHAGGGHGLTGLGDRVARRGGVLDYGPTAAGFEVSLRTGSR